MHFDGSTNDFACKVRTSHANEKVKILPQRTPREAAKDAKKNENCPKWERRFYFSLYFFVLCDLRG